jgi:hypothetical protein
LDRHDTPPGNDMVVSFTTVNPAFNVNWSPAPDEYRTALEVAPVVVIPMIWSVASRVYVTTLAEVPVVVVVPATSVEDTVSPSRSVTVVRVPARSALASNR